MCIFSSKRIVRNKQLLQSILVELIYLGDFSKTTGNMLMIWEGICIFAGAHLRSQRPQPFFLGGGNCEHC